MCQAIRADTTYLIPQSNELHTRMFESISKRMEILLPLIAWHKAVWTADTMVSHREMI